MAVPAFHFELKKDAVPIAFRGSKWFPIVFRKNIPPLEMFHYKTFITVCPNHLIFVASSISRTDVGSYTNLDNKIDRGTLKYQSILKIF